jgi:5-methylthioadenosine/S-adenosylhomocysteine deaminase
MAPHVATQPGGISFKHRAIAPAKFRSTFRYGAKPAKPFYETLYRPSTKSLLLRGGLVVTQDAERHVISGDVLVEDGRIAAVGQVDQSADDVLDCTGCVVLPGFVNLHNHVANTLLRGVADDVPLEEMLPKAAAIDAKLTRRDVQVGALLGCVEMIRSGTTSFHDLFYWEDEVARAVRESGMRGFLSWVTLDESKTTQQGSPLKNADAFVTKQKGDPLVTPSVGVQGVYAASEETFTKAKELAERHDVRLHMHLAETRGEVEGHRQNTGLRPIAWLEKIGFLDSRLTAAHGVWTTINEVRTLARHRVSVAHCPVSNMKLASGGVAPVPEMLREGVVVGLGTDSPISNNSMDMFGDMKIASLLHKATRWDARVMPAQTVLDMATIEAARALRMDAEIGSVQVGKRADLAVVSMRGAHTTPFYAESVIGHLVYSARGSDVQATIVDGQVLMSDRIVRTVDEADVVSRAQETARELFEA